MIKNTSEETCEQLIKEILEINNHLLDNLKVAGDDPSTINNYIAERLTLIKKLMVSDNKAWHLTNNKRLLELQQSIQQIESEYIKQRDELRNKIHQQKHTNKGVMAYKKTNS